MTHPGSAVRFATLVVAVALTSIVVAQNGQVLIDTVRTVTPQIPGQQGAVAMGAVQQNGTGLIVGQVVDADSGRPIAGAIVTIGGATSGGAVPAAPRVAFATGGAGGGGPISVGAPSQNPRVLSDGDGRFAFRSLPKGAYNFTAQKPGFVDGAYGRLRPGGSSQSVDLADGENRGDVKVRLFKFASISGIVVDESGEPIVGAQIRAFRRGFTAGRRTLGAVTATAQTDDRGMYRLGSLIPGEYVIAAPTVQSSAPADFQLQGRLAPDLISTLASGSGGFSLQTGGSPVTPDGKFLLQNNNGRTITPATPSGRAMVYATQYYPNAATTQQATAIVVKSGEERGGIDMQLRLVPALNIGGRLMTPDGPAVNWGVHLVPADTSDLSADPDVATSITNGNGEFMFLAVPAGQYVIQTVRVPRGGPASGAQTFVFNTGAGTSSVSFSSNTTSSLAVSPQSSAPASQDPTLWTATPIALGNDDITDLSISLRTGFRVSGRVDFQGSAERPPADRLALIPVTIEPADGKQKTQSVFGRVDQAGNFTTTGLLPGKYFVRIGSAPSGWTFKSAVLGGADVSETPIEIEDRDVAGVVVTFNDAPTDLRGTVKSSDGAADDGSAVVVFPSDNRAWMDYGINPRRVRLARTTKTGTYSFGALPAGEYYVAAFSEEYAGEWQDPRFLDLLSRGATRVTLNDAEKRTQDLTRLSVRPGATLEPEAVSPADGPATSGPYVPETDQLPQQTQTQSPPRDTKPAPTPTPKPAAQPARDAAGSDTGTGSIAGVVLLDDASQQPLRHTRVTLRGLDARADRTVTTDDQGRFEFSGIAAGNYSVTAAKSAYVSIFYGSKHAGRGPGTPLSITSGQRMSDVKLMMPRGGVITGRAIDDFGSPVPNAGVRIMQYRNVGGERTLVSAGAGSVITDDRGIYRAYGLTPGAYVVSITPPGLGFGGDLRMLSPNDMQAALAAVQQSAAQSGASAPGSTVNAANRPAGGAGAGTPVPAPGKAVGYSTVYYPGTWSSADAQVVTVAAGQELSGIDIPVHLLPMSRLEGTVIGADGQPAAGAQLTFVPMGVNNTLGNFSSFRTGPDGKFSTQNIAPGHYQLTARGGGGGPSFVMMGGPGGGGVGIAPPPPPPPPPPPGVNGISIGGDIVVGGSPGSRLYAQQELDFAGEDVTGVTMTLQEGMTLSGKIVFAGRTLTAPSDLSRVSIGLTPAGPRGIIIGAPVAQVTPAGEFTMAGIMPGKYRLTANIGGGWTLKSAMVGGHDAFDESIDVKAGQNVEGAVLTFTDQMAELSGRLIDAAGKPAPGFTILLFSADRAFWPIGSRRIPPPIRPASDGKYRVTGLPAGEYYLAAVTDIDPQDWGDPAFMEQIVPGAIKITLGDGEKKVQDLKVGGGDS